MIFLLKSHPGFYELVGVSDYSLACKGLVDLPGTVTNGDPQKEMVGRYRYSGEIPSE